jgi:hypothetical protein
MMPCLSPQDQGLQKVVLRDIVSVEAEVRSDSYAGDNLT